MKAPARLSVVELTYYQLMEGGQPTCVDVRFSRWLHTEEQPCIRKLVATEEWETIKGNWVEDVSMVVIENHTGKGRQTIPTPEEKAFVESQVIEIGFETFPSIYIALLVHPGEAVRFAPNDFKALRLRCRNGEAKYTATVFPK